jgi:hypothetical protein
LARKVLDSCRDTAQVGTQIHRAESPRPRSAVSGVSDVSGVSMRCPPWSDTEDERAAIIEIDGGAPRDWAEALTRLDPTKPPGDVSPKRWLQFVDDCSRFVDDGWAQRALDLGWTPYELFGCDRLRPIERVDRAGLLWLLDGRKVRALSADRAVIAVDRGQSLTFYKRRHETGQILAWELASLTEEHER